MIQTLPFTGCLVCVYVFLVTGVGGGQMALDVTDRASDRTLVHVRVRTARGPLGRMEGRWTGGAQSSLQLNSTQLRKVDGGSR